MMKSYSIGVEPAMTQANLLQLASQGDEGAIASLIEDWLAPRPINAKVRQKNDCLLIILESDSLPEQKTVVPLIRERLLTLELPALKQIKIFGKERGEDFPEWHNEFILTKSQANPLQEQAEFVGSLLGKVAGTASVVGGIAAQAGQAVAETATGAATQAGQAVAGTAVGIGEAVGGATIQATKGVGAVLDWIGSNPLSRQVTKALPFNWLFIVNQVDVEKAAAEVKKLTQQHPQDKPDEIAHRLMVNKAVLSAGTGFVSSLVPGFAAPLFAIDLAANLVLQAELVYQIAYAYGLDIKDPERKGEILTIFGLALGGGQALKVGGSYAARAGFLGFLRNIPVAGAVVGTSTNAAMTYALGYAACRYYESKVNPFTSETTLAASTEESEKYLEEAIAQEVIMDQILVYVVLAGKPGKTWAEILPELESLNLSPASTEAIAAASQSPPSLEDLLTQINRDFALPLLVKCRQVAQADQTITAEEAEVIEKITKTITERFEIDLDSLQGLPS